MARLPTRSELHEGIKLLCVLDTDYSEESWQDKFITVGMSKDDYSIPDSDGEYTLSYEDSYISLDYDSLTGKEPYNISILDKEDTFHMILVVESSITEEDKFMQRLSNSWDGIAESIGHG